MTTTERIVIDHLTYASYRWQRINSPEVSPERWGLIFRDWRALEARYQAETNKGNQ
jgi:hypothetical protein